MKKFNQLIMKQNKFSKLTPNAGVSPMKPKRHTTVNLYSEQVMNHNKKVNGSSNIIDKCKKQRLSATDDATKENKMNNKIEVRKIPKKPLMQYQKNTPVYTPLDTLTDSHGNSAIMNNDSNRVYHSNSQTSTQNKQTMSASGHDGYKNLFPGLKFQNYLINRDSSVKERKPTMRNFLKLKMATSNYDSEGLREEKSEKEFGLVNGRIIGVPKKYHLAKF